MSVDHDWRHGRWERLQAKGRLKAIRKALAIALSALALGLAALVGSIITSNDHATSATDVANHLCAVVNYQTRVETRVLDRFGLHKLTLDFPHFDCPLVYDQHTRQFRKVQP